jgi:hypothetical protein
MKCYDLDNLDIVIVKDWQSLLDALQNLLLCCQEIEANTDEIEAKLDAQIALLTTINTNIATITVDIGDIKTAIDAIKVDTTAIIAELVTLNAKDFATETTLNSLLTCCAAIQAVTDQMEFVDGKLRTTGEDGGGGGGGGGCCQGANATHFIKTFPAPAAVDSLAASNSARKEIIISNNGNKTAWICFGAIAGIGTGIPIRKKDILIDTVYTGDISYIGEAGMTGDLTITEVTT